LRAGAREHPLTSQHHLTRARSRATPWSFAPGARRRLDNGSPSTPHARSRRKVVSAMSRPTRAEAMFSKPLALLFDPGSSRRLCASRRCRPSWRSFGARCVRVQREKAWVNQGAKSACPFLRESARDLISLRRGLDSN
jgi:hypothetical protein